MKRPCPDPRRSRRFTPGRLLGLLAAGLSLAPRPALGAETASAAPRPGAFQEAAGLVVIETEHYQAITSATCWTRVAGLSGQAMKVLEGPWPRHLRYDIDFKGAGLYRMHVLGRKNPQAPQYAGNDLKVFLYPAGHPSPKVAPGYALFEIGFGEQKEFGWRGTPKSKDNSVKTTDLTIPKPGRYHLYIVGGAGEEAGWELDRILLTLDNRQPPAGAAVGPAESEIVGEGSAPRAEAPAKNEGPVAVTLDFGVELQQLDGAEGASVCQFHSVKPDGSAAVANVAYSPLRGFPDDSPSTEFGKFCDAAFSIKGMGMSQHWVTPCPIQTPPGSVGDRYSAEAWTKLDFSMYEPNVLTPDRFYNSHGDAMGEIRGHTVPMLMASLRRARAEGTRVSYWTDVHTDFPPWMWKDGLRKNPVRDEMFEEAALHTVYFIKYLTAKHGVPIHAASFINEPDMPNRHAFTPEQQLRGAKILREKLDEAGLNGVRVLPCTAISLSRVHLDWANKDADTLRKLVELLVGPMKEYAPYVDIIGGHGSQNETPISRRPANTTFWRASGDFNEHWTNTIGFDFGPPQMIDEVIRHNTWLYGQKVAQAGIWQVASRMGIGGDFFKMPEKYDPATFGRPETVNGAAVVYPYVRPGMSVVGGSLGRSSREPCSVDGFTGPGQRNVIVITNDGIEREFRIALKNSYTRLEKFDVYQATVEGRKAAGQVKALEGRLTMRVPADSVTTLLSADGKRHPRVTLVTRKADANTFPSGAALVLGAWADSYESRIVSQALEQKEQDALHTKRLPVDPFGTSAYVIDETVDSLAAVRAHRTVMAPVVVLGEANARALGLKVGERIEAGAPLSFRDELDPPASMLEGGLSKACGRRIALPADAKGPQIAAAIAWALDKR